MDAGNRVTLVALLIPAALLAVAARAGTAGSDPGEDAYARLVKASALNRLGFYGYAAATMSGAEFEPGSSWDSISRVVKARAMPDTKAGAADAVRLLEGIKEDSIPPSLRSIVSFEQGRAALAAGDPAGAARMASFIDRFPGSPDEAEARLLSGYAMLEDGNPDGAREQAVKVLSARPARSREARARLLRAMASPEPERSLLLRRLFVEMPDTAAAGETGLEAGSLTDGELRERADAFYKAWDFINYQSTLEMLRARGDDSPGLAWELARSHLIHVRDKPRETVELMQYARARGVGTGPEGTFLLGRAWARLEDYDNAANCFSEYIRSGAKPQRMLAHYYLAWLPYDHREYEKALPEIDRFLKMYRKSDRYSYMIWFKGWSLFRLGRYREAIEVFGQMKRLGNCLVAGKAMYWGGVAWHRLGNSRQAGSWMREVINRYPMTWYSVLAAYRLKEYENIPLPAWMTAPAAVQRDPAPLWYTGSMPPDVIATLREVRALAAVGEPGEALKLYRKVSARAERHLAGAELARFLITQSEATEQYNALLKRSEKIRGLRRSRSPEPEAGLYWMARYPRAFRPLVSAAAGQYGIPELWVYSIMRQESRYDASQVSYVAALGAMQMIAATAHIVGGQVGIRWELDSFFDPGVNILFGTKYLSDLYRDFKGQIVFASAAYNSGAPAIRRFMLENRGLPLDEMVEMIPYNQGRNYCRKVAEHLVRYGAIYLSPEERMELYGRIFVPVVDYGIGDAVDY